jgi:hypothetical protein
VVLAFLAIADGDAPAATSSSLHYPDAVLEHSAIHKCRCDGIAGEFRLKGGFVMADLQTGARALVSLL